jgi:leucine dehydrogenase
VVTLPEHCGGAGDIGPATAFGVLQAMKACAQAVWGSDSLRCAIVCGSANNQLAEERHGDALAARGILYAPDYVANSGGTIYDTDRLQKGGFNRERAWRNVARIRERMAELIAISRREAVPTWLAADRLAERRLEMAQHLRLI